MLGGAFRGGRGSLGNGCVFVYTNIHTLGPRSLLCVCITNHASSSLPGDIQLRQFPGDIERRLCGVPLFTIWDNIGEREICCCGG